MEKLYFYYGSMNSTKTTSLLQSAYNYSERGMRTLLLKPNVDQRETRDHKIVSRIGLDQPCTVFTPEDDLYVEFACASVHGAPIACVLVDEAQFLTPVQVKQLAAITTHLQTPVLCYGLRVDFRGECFPGSAALLATADKLVEMKSICGCGSKATHVLRKTAEGTVVTEGPQIQIGGNDRYEAVCRGCFEDALLRASLQGQDTSGLAYLPECCDVYK